MYRSQVLATFEDIAQKPENSEVWSADTRNLREAAIVRYHFHGDKVLLFGDSSENVSQRALEFETLVSSLLNVLDKA